MTLIYIGLATIVILVTSFFLFRRPKNQFLIDVDKMSGKDRAVVLIAATVLRVKWEQDNPDFSEIFLDPAAFPPKDCDLLFSDLLNLIVLLRKQNETYETRLREMGASDKLPDDHINACRVWMGTIGARNGKMKLDDIVTLWSYLHECIPFLGEALAELKTRHELYLQLNLGYVGPFLEGLPIQRIIHEAGRTPNLSALRV